MNAFFANRLALVDLQTGDTAFQPLPDGAASAARPLAEALAECFPDALIIALGPLTGSHAPASCLLMAHVAGAGPQALKGRCGPALRLCGLDALVVKGQAGSPVAICLDEKDISLRPVDSGMDIPALRAALLRPLPDAGGFRDSEPTLILAGPAAFRNSPAAIACLDFGLAPGTASLAAAMAGRRLAAIRMDGGRPWRSPLPLDNPARNAVKAERVTPGSLTTLFAATGGQGASGPDAAPEIPANALSALGNILGRSLACSGCPSPCGFWLRSGDRHHLDGRHAACTDPAGLAALLAAGIAPAQAALLLKLCDRFGLAPAAFAGQAGKNRAGADGLPSDLDACLELLAAYTKPASAPGKADPAFANLGFWLGICPFFLKRHPELDEATLLACLNAAESAAPKHADARRTGR